MGRAKINRLVLRANRNNRLASTGVIKNVVNNVLCRRDDPGRQKAKDIMATTNTASYFVVSAPGHYGDSTRVMSSHRTLKAALKARGEGECVREGSLTKGATFLRSAESVYPRADV